MDLNVLQVILALAGSNMLASTVILFHADIGGFIQAGSLNIPFNGQKSTYYDGGVRVPAFIYNAAEVSLSGQSGDNNYIIDDIFDVTDVLPTLLAYAGLCDRG